MTTEPYRPSNGTEGEIFQGQWCYHCARFEPEEGEYCPILGAAMMNDIGDEEFPSEWVRDAANGPRCTAFTTDPDHPPRCTQTADLFDGA